MKQLSRDVSFHYAHRASAIIEEADNPTEYMIKASTSNNEIQTTIVDIVHQGKSVGEVHIMNGKDYLFTIVDRSDGSILASGETKTFAHAVDRVVGASRWTV